MPKAAALEALLKSYREEIDWLLAKAKEYEGKQDMIAKDYIHRARNLQAVIDAFERAKAP